MTREAKSMVENTQQNLTANASIPQFGRDNIPVTRE
jgi:hypothetical protein